MFHSIRYLEANDLPFRGDNEDLNLEGEVYGGLFLNTLQHLVFQLQPELANIFKRLPRNAKYLTSDIQNEFIEILGVRLNTEKHRKAPKSTEKHRKAQISTSEKHHRKAPESTTEKHRIAPKSTTEKH